MNTMLHLINKSPYDRKALDSCLRLAETGSSVLLIEDGVYAALNQAESAGAICKRMDELKFYVLGPDISARGLDDMVLIDGFTIVDYDGFVDLVIGHDVAQSWL